MLLSMNWIRDFVDLDGLDIDALIHRFTLTTAEVEDIFHKGADTRGVVVGRILTCLPHPDSQKLHLLTVDAGNGPVDCVCGAPNAREGLTVAFATAGGSVCGNEIREAKIAGYPSRGMCCSAAELGISADASGLWELPDTLIPGTDIKEIYPIDDVIFEVDNKSLTNRPDLWGHYGIAREFAAMTGRELRPYEKAALDKYSGLPGVEIDIKDTEHCYRYSSVKVDNVTVHESPEWMRIRLFYCGMRGINLLTDLTNYLMLELGQPMHAFDRRRVDRIEVQRFAEPFEFQTLDDQIRRIDPDTMMITSGGKPVAIAGIMGGLDSSIMDDTTQLLLESANFDGVSVRRSSMRLGLRTDASMRYEKMLDPELTVNAVERFVYLLGQIDPGAEIVSSLSDSYPTKYPEIELTFDRAYVDRYTGIDIPDAEITDTLSALGFGIRQDGDVFTVRVPSWRSTKDVTIKADIIEEITRVYGYDNFEIKTTRSPLVPRLEDPGRRTDRRLQDMLVLRYGLHEVQSYVWCDSRKFAALGIEVEDNVRVVNAQTVDNSVLRSCMIPTLLCFDAENKGFAPEYGMFEIGRVVCGRNADGTANERKHLGIVLHSHEKSEKELFFRLRDMLCAAAEDLKHVGLTFENVEPAHNWQHPRNTAAVMLNGTRIGELCTLHPTTASAIDKKAAIVAAEIDLPLFTELPGATLTYSEPSRFPGIDVDLTFLAGGHKYSELARAWEGAGLPLLTGVSLVDVYDGGERSISVRLSFSSPERTLTRAEIQPVVDGVIDALAKKGIPLKSN